MCCFESETSIARPISCPLCSVHYWQENLQCVQWSKAARWSLCEKGIHSWTFFHPIVRLMFQKNEKQEMKRRSLDSTKRHMQRWDLPGKMQFIRIRQKKQAFRHVWVRFGELVLLLAASTATQPNLTSQWLAVDSEAGNSSQISRKPWLT